MVVVFQEQAAVHRYDAVDDVPSLCFTRPRQPVAFGCLHRAINDHRQHVFGVRRLAQQAGDDTALGSVGSGTITDGS
jgi:hypothetical protein